MNEARELDLGKRFLQQLRRWFPGYHVDQTPEDRNLQPAGQWSSDDSFRQKIPEPCWEQEGHYVCCRGRQATESTEMHVPCKFYFKAKILQDLGHPLCGSWPPM